MPTVGVEFAKVSYTLPRSADGQTRRVLLRDISLELEAGTTTALLGRSGSGKTTLLRMVNGLVTPTSGEVLVAGKATPDYDTVALRRGIGYVIQETGLFPHLTVERNAGMALELAGRSKQEIAARVGEKKRRGILAKAKDLNFHIANPGKEEGRAMAEQPAVEAEKSLPAETGEEKMEEKAEIADAEDIDKTEESSE